MKPLSILFLLLFSLSVFADENVPKKVIGPDEEFEGKEEKEPEQLKDANSTVTGEDQSLFKDLKKDGEYILPTETKAIDWEEAQDQIARKEKQGVRKVEKKARIRTEYGSYDSLGFNLYLTKKAADRSIYLVEYERYQHRHIGFDGTKVFNSEESLDKLKLVSVFKMSKAYNLFFKLGYEDTLLGLQSNSSATQLFKQGTEFTVQNLLRPTANQKLSIEAKGVAIGASTKSNAAGQSSTFGRLGLSADWQLILGERSSIDLGADFWYGENTLFAATEKLFYRVGNLYALYKTPVFRNFVGQESESKTRWALDVTIGVQTFTGGNFAPVIGPVFMLHNTYGNWYSKLGVKRNGRLLNNFNHFLRKPYYKAVHYTRAEDLWAGIWENSFSISKDVSVGFNAGVNYYNTFYHPVLDTDGLYELTPTILRVAYGALSYEHNITDDFYYELGVTYDRQIDIVFLTPQLSGFLKLNYTYNKWNMALETRYIGERNQQSQTLSAFVLLNASIETRFNNTISLFIRGENLFNEKFQWTPPYDVSGLRVFAGLQIFI